jgi:hypothetical protein
VDVDSGGFKPNGDSLGYNLPVKKLSVQDVRRLIGQAESVANWTPAAQRGQGARFGRGKRTRACRRLAPPVARAGRVRRGADFGRACHLAEIMGDRVGLHPLTIIIAEMVGTTLLGGLLGGILPIPLTAVLRAVMFRYVWKKRETWGGKREMPNCGPQSNWIQEW